MTTDKPGITFSKLNDGSWGIRAVATKIEPGDTVGVMRKDGKQVPATVRAVLWRGQVDGVEVIRASIEEPTAPKRGGKATNEKKTSAAPAAKLSKEETW